MHLKAPAKVNLTLEVLRRRGDGYHEIRSIIQAIGLYDEIEIRESGKLEVFCDTPGWRADLSVATRAAQMMQEMASGRGAVIEVKKRIPLMSGLGGDSSDAAAVLRGLNELWGIHLSKWQLAEVAARLGSDVTFFLYGGTALAEGRGEVVSPLPALPHHWVVVLLPPVEREPGKTGRLYQSLDENRFTEGQISDKLLDIITSGGNVTPADLYNIFESVVDLGYEYLERHRWHFLESGASRIRLAGSGPALFGLFKGEQKARDIYTSLEDKGFEAYLAETLRGVEK
jgi:4-diphosphocytidyl-2-C-methyl-D-erythritol kinase